MDIYFDKENFEGYLDDLFKVESSKDEARKLALQNSLKKVNGMTCRQRIHINMPEPTNRKNAFNKDGDIICFNRPNVIDDKSSAKVINPFIDKFTKWKEISNEPIDIFWGEEFCTENITFEVLTSVAFLTQKHAADIIKKDRRFRGLLVSNESVKDIMTRLMINGKDVPARLLYTPAYKKSDNWKDIFSNNLPFTDLIIADPYIFLGVKAGRNNYENNVLSIIDAICEPLRDTKIEIKVIFICYSSSKYKIKNEDGTFEQIKEYPDWKTLQNTICDRIRNCIGTVPNVCFVKPKEGALPDSIEIGQHDRTIWTNYMMYSSGDSFTYYNSDGEFKSKGLWISKSALTDKENELIAKAFISRVNNIIIECQKQKEDNYWRKGWIKSNFLNF